jgi:hypothetical protein
MNDQTGPSRRAVLDFLGTATLLGLTGCIGNSQNNEQSGSVPKPYRTATSQGGMKRKPNNLTSKSGANYQPNSSHKQTCSTCRYYIPDKNNDDLGACSLVKGDIKPKAWCTLYAPYQKNQG